MVVSSGPKCPGKYQCLVDRGPHKCVKRSEICDGNADCPNGDDEDGCRKYYIYLHD